MTFENPAGDLPPQPKRIHWLWWLFIGLFFTVAVLVIVWVYRNYSDERYLADVIAELDRTDPGWHSEEIEGSRRKLTDEQNGANVVTKALGLLPGSFLSTTFHEKFHGDGYEDLNVQPAAQLDETRTALLRAELAPLAQGIAEARRLIEYAYGRYPLPAANNPLNLSLTHIHQTRQLANLLMYDAQLRAQEGDADGAVASAHALLNVGRSIGDESFLISLLVRLAERNIAARTVERILAQGEPSEPMLARLQAALMQDEAEPILVAALRGERAWQDIVCGQLEHGQITWKQLGLLAGPGGPGSKSNWIDDLMGRWMQFSTSLAKNRGAMLEYNTRIIAIAKDPLHLQDAQVRAMEKNIPGMPPLVRLLVPASAKVMAANRQSQAEIRCAIAAIAAERFRLANGRWPESLSELTPKFLPHVPLDSFDGAPLRYRKTEQGMLIYSVGFDGKDDGGKLDRTKAAVSPGLDLGIWLFDVPKRRQPAVPRAANQTAK